MPHLVSYNWSYLPFPIVFLITQILLIWHPVSHTSPLLSLISLSLLSFSHSSACSFLAYGRSTEKKRRNLQPPTAQLTASAPYARDLCFGLVTTPWAVPAFGFSMRIIWINFLLLLQAFTCCVVQFKCLSLPRWWGSNTQHPSHVGSV